MLGGGSGLPTQPLPWQHLGGGQALGAGGTGELPQPRALEHLAPHSPGMEDARGVPRLVRCNLCSLPLVGGKEAASLQMVPG